MEEVRAVYLSLKQFLNIYITFPGHNDLQRIKETFYAIAGFPNVLGCIDCSHVRIVAPSGPVERDYVDRRNHHSLNVQMICDANYLITNIEVKWPVGVHDARIFRASSVLQRLAQREFEGIFLGDRGYPCLPYRLTPYSDPGTEAEEAFNGALNSTRARIEMVFGQLKSRFQCLKYLRVAPERACDITVACAILHNIATIRRERLLGVTLEETWEDPNRMPEDMDGRAVRDLYRDTHFA
ncbi:putative nuclease HARBI1 [Solea solea]|uniref:putative nuclease HARBI1 n=1 Tax=Solea solea TaxID=90069 RepID=UPI00272A334B|nr:putative nuclease HARBI1 [Solea solea]